jgi:hypothetical protein
VTSGAPKGVYQVAASYRQALMTNTISANNSLREIGHMKGVRRIALHLMAIAVLTPCALAQVPAKDPSARLKEVLPPDVAARVLARIADARARQLPAEALENRALKFAAKGVDPKSIERSVNEQAQRMDSARSALERGRGSKPAGDEIEAGAEAIRKGVDGASVSLLAKSVPQNRSLAVPLFVIGSLTDRGLPADQALQRVLSRLKARASDADLESMSSEASAGGNAGQGRPDGTSGRDFGQSHQPSTTGRPATAGPPAGVPGNAGKKSNPGQSHRPPPKN